jgi:uncharacterized Zn-binding protein involved in type VI secretion
VSLGAARCFQDSAGGSILGPGASTVLVNGSPVSVAFDAVAGHGDPPHSAPKMVTYSSKVYANGKGIVRETDSASCGHPASGSSNVRVG